MSAISSKSAVHRILISAFLCKTPTYVDFNGYSKDISATIDCLVASGATISPTDTGVLVTPPTSFDIAPDINCAESGSTLRFLLPVMSAMFGTYSVTAKGGLRERPLSELIDCLSSQGASFSANTLPLTASGRLISGNYSIAGNVSSQYISGLLFALPLLDGDSKITLTCALSSSAYVDMTIQTLRDFGIVIEQTDYGFFIRGNQTYTSPARIFAEGDWSGATFWLCAGAVMGPITVHGLLYNSLQADRRILDLLTDMGANISMSDNSITVSRGSLSAIDVDIDSSPDIMPVLSMLFAFCDGVSTIYNGERLHIKESDRISAMADVLKSLAIPVTHGRGTMAVTGAVPESGVINGANDHRIIMAATLASLATDLSIIGSLAVDKSYPSFFDDFAKLGGHFEII